MATKERKTTLGGVKTAEVQTDKDNLIHLPEKCAACPAKLYVGISVFILSCHLHAICSAHDIPATWGQPGCPYCRDIEEMERKKKEKSRPRKVRNSLNPIPMTEITGVALASKSHLYEYPRLWPTRSIQSLTSDRSIGIDAAPVTCWSAGDNDSILVGGYNKHDQPTLSVVTATGRYITHVLSCGREVLSGLLVKMLLHIVCVTYDDEWWKNISSNKLHLITLDPTSTHYSIIHPLITLDVTNPVNVFRKSTQLCGVLCMDGSHPNTHGRIRLLGLDQLILPTYTDLRTLQSTALWGRRTLLHLDLPEPHPYDTVAVTPRGQYCIASFIRHEILVYSNTGVYLYSVGEKQSYSSTSYLDGLYSPVSVQCTADNCVIVTGLRGDIRMYNMSSETGSLMRRIYDGWKYRMVNDDDSDNEEYDKNGRRKVYYHKDDPDGWRIVRRGDRRDESRHYYSALTSSRVWDIDISNEQRIHVSNIIQ